MAAPKTSRRKPLCCLRIGYTELLLDADKGAQVLKLLSDSVQCNAGYEGRGHVYVIENAPELELRMVNPDSVRQAETRESHLLPGA